MCKQCKVLDDENHRLNYCPEYLMTNQCNKENKVDFDQVFIEDPVIVKRVVPHIANVWNLNNSHGVMNDTQPT